MLAHPPSNVLSASLLAPTEGNIVLVQGLLYDLQAKSAHKPMIVANRPCELQKLQQCTGLWTQLFVGSLLPLNAPSHILLSYLTSLARME